MARIKTKRPEAMAYDGQEGKFVRDVVDNEPAYSAVVDQVVVNIGGRDLYFYANEVELSDGEKKSADKARKEWEESVSTAEADRSARFKAKADLLAGYKRGKEGDPMGEAHRASGGIAPMDIPAHAGATPQQVLAGTSPFNRVPGEPERTAEQDGAGSNIGPSGYPMGSGPDPQGRRVNEKDQSKNDPRERPVPGAQESHGPYPSDKPKK